MIDKYCNINSTIFDILFEVYYMKNWRMSQAEFFALAKEEIDKHLQEIIDNPDVYFDKDEE